MKHISELSGHQEENKLKLVLVNAWGGATLNKCFIFKMNKELKKAGVGRGSEFTGQLHHCGFYPLQK